MTILAAVGLGYCARHLVATAPEAFSRVIGTARTPESLSRLPQGVDGHLFDGTAVSAALAEALEEADILLLSAPPDENGDPLLARARDRLAGGRLKQIVYLTTLGVYGDHAGAWVDETTAPRAGSPRLERRLQAERELFAFGEAHGVRVAALRLAGIYGPGRSALLSVKAGEARCIDKPGQVFNRIHVDDISSAIRAVIAQGFSGILNVTDDLPSSPADPVAYAAELLGMPAPERVPFAEVARSMSPMALTFWAANKRVSNTRLKGELGVRLAYPTYREGLSALLAAGEGR